MSLFGKTDSNLAVPKNLQIGRINGVQVVTGGSGYTNGATQPVTFSAPSGSGGVTATATANVVGGAVMSISMTNKGSGYITSPTITIPGASNATFYIAKQAMIHSPSSIVFVDDAEAKVLSNKSKGITSPGWWSVVTKLNDSGDTTYKVELLATISSSPTAIGDKEEDLVIPDVDSVASITVQPTNQVSVTGSATVSVTAALTGGGSLLYQWQVATPAKPKKFTNVPGATSASLVLTGRNLGNSGERYRCVVSGGGSKSLNSNPATVTFGT